MFEITKNYGPGTSIALVFDETANAWAVAGIGESNGISNRLDAAAPDANLEANSPGGMIVTDFGTYGCSGWSGCNAGPVNSFTVPAGSEARLLFTCGSFCDETTLATRLEHGIF